MRDNSIDHHGVQTSNNALPSQFRLLWLFAQRVLFRFVVVYFVLYNLPFPITLFEGISFVGNALEQCRTVLHNVISWVGKYGLHLRNDIVIVSTGSGDRLFDYVLVLCFVVLAFVVALVWTFFDRRRTMKDFRVHSEENSKRLHEWVMLYLRFALASVLCLYGWSKIIPPAQFSPPSLSRLMQPIGDTSPMGLLWTFMGASPVYTAITGWVEVLGGILLMIPATTILGGLVSMLAMAQVFILNMCYDVSVKLFSFHLLLMSVLIVIPVRKRLMNALVLNRPVDAAVPVPMFKRSGFNRYFSLAQIACGCCIAVLIAWQVYMENEPFDNTSTEDIAPFIGAWRIEEFTIKSESHSSRTEDAMRWKRVFFDDELWFAIQLDNDSRERYLQTLDMEKKTIRLQKRGIPEWKASLSFEQPTQDSLILSGLFGGQEVYVKAYRLPKMQFRLTSQRFHWIREYPTNY